MALAFVALYEVLKYGDGI